MSGPLLDRFDMRIEMARVPAAQLLSRRLGEASGVVAARICAARELALERNRGMPNGLLSGAAAQRACALDSSTRDELARLASATQMTSRGVHRVLRVARTIADLENRAAVSNTDIHAAVQLREPGSAALSVAA